MRATKAQKKKAEKLAAEIAGHKRYADLEKLIDAMYDRADTYENNWSTEKTELEIELAGLKDWLESIN